SKKILMPNPTWGNHVAIFKNSGLEPGYYRYFDAKNNKVGKATCYVYMFLLLRGFGFGLG
ncbi:aminotransferase class I/II-fold pyridoxal phosphate-dependent enzyme, partial [archaeon]